MKSGLSIQWSWVRVLSEVHLSKDSDLLHLFGLHNNKNNGGLAHCISALVTQNREKKKRLCRSEMFPFLKLMPPDTSFNSSFVQREQFIGNSH